ncbi:MAG: type II toxin-antitoxin system VapC family toxin [Demequina sp.]|nr:type II toxin-antitoxin system VapC family toxin [Demequina sp.]
MTLRAAFDADVLIYAGSQHPLGASVNRLFETAEGQGLVGMGSVLLLPEVLSKPMRDDPESHEARTLRRLIGRLDLRAFDQRTARLALVLAAKYRLQGADAAHLATAVAGGAEWFITNNRKDFSHAITEIDIVYPDQLPGYA